VMVIRDESFNCGRKRVFKIFGGMQTPDRKP
jgi:hypothetical protein